MKRKTQTSASTRRAPAKRAAMGCPAPTASIQPTVARVLAEPFLLDNIIAFMPIRPTRLGRRSDALHFIWAVQGLSDLARSTRYARENQDYWCEKLFAFFDFTLATGSLQFHDLNDIHVERDPEWKAHKTARTKRLRCRYWQRDLDEDYDVVEELPPDAFLTEEFRLWSNLYVYHRASQYGFLTDIQRGEKTMRAFPESINAFELFEDLAVLVSELRVRTLVVDRKARKRMVADPEIYPCLLRRMPKKVTPRGTDLLDVCAISATFWDSAVRMVSSPWPGLSPEAHRALMASRFARDVDESEMVLQSETESQFDDFFGRWGGRDRAKLEAVVRRYFADWRHVRVHNDDGPQFYVGKRSGTNRWMGFISCAI